MSATVQVAVRARPFSQREIDLKSPTIVEMRNKSTILFKTTAGIAIGETRDRSKEFVYDHSYWSVEPQDTHYTSQEQVFSDLGKAVLESAFEGYNACVFAYGQTGSGKTYTMMGTESAPGLIPRICESLFSRIATGSLRKVSYRTEASYMEIYNEKVRDLLRPGANKSPHSLRVREHPKNGPYVENLSKHYVNDYRAIRDLMNLGNSHRATASTLMNDVSSRSHAIFTVTFTQATYSSDLPCETVSKINLVDLAGSERASTTGAEGIRLKEGGSINKSLVCLGNVISALADMSSHSTPSKKHYIPYRDSVLTWLLKDSLGGNSKTIMIATVSPAESSYGETLSTLRYASRAKNIVNKPVVNEDPNVKLIRELRAEIRRLKAIITGGRLGSEEQFRDRTDSILMVADIQRKEEQIAELTRTWAGKWKDIQTMIEDRNLALSSEGIKMTVASEQPHFIDILGTGVVLYHLQEGQTRIGSRDSSPKADIVLTAVDIQPEHCVVEYTDDQVSIHTRDGRCYVNTVEVTQQTRVTHDFLCGVAYYQQQLKRAMAANGKDKSTHILTTKAINACVEYYMDFKCTGDLVQLGDFTALRFNHPREALQSSGVGGSVMSPLAFSGRSALEEQRSALERDYEERIRVIREELERKNEEEKAQMKQELEEVKRQSLLITGEQDSGSDDNDLGRCRVDSDPYDVLRSMAFIPMSPQPFSTREVIGEEAETDYHSTKGSDSPSKDPEHGKRSNGEVEESSESVTEESSNMTTTNEMSQQMLESQSEHVPLDISFISSNLGMFDLDASDLSPVPPSTSLSQSTKHASVFEAYTQPAVDVSCQSTSTEQRTEEEPDSRLVGLLEDELEDAKGRLLLHEQEGKLAEEQLREAEKAKAETLKKNTNLEALCQQKEEEQQRLHKQLQEMEVELRKKNLFDLLEAEPRRRSYAFSDNDRPKPKIRRRSRSLRSQRTVSPIKVEIPRYFLRGNGVNSYHVYEIKIQLGSDRWSVYRRYANFRQFHEDIKKKYPQLALLPLPRSKWFGFKSEEFVRKRRESLECYLQSFVGVCMNVSGSPLSESAVGKLTKEKLGAFSEFFVSGSLKADVL